MQSDNIASSLHGKIQELGLTDPEAKILIKVANKPIGCAIGSLSATSLNPNDVQPLIALRITGTTERQLTNGQKKAYAMLWDCLDRLLDDPNLGDFIEQNIRDYGVKAIAYAQEQADDEILDFNNEIEGETDDSSRNTDSTL